MSEWEDDFEDGDEPDRVYDDEFEPFGDEPEEWHDPGPPTLSPWLPQRVRTRADIERRERTLDDFIARFTDAEPIWDRSERVVIFEASGYFMSQDAHIATRAMTQYLPQGFHEVERWGNAFRTVWINQEVGATISYVEGDVRVSIARTRLDWIEERDDIERFYLLHP